MKKVQTSAETSKEGAASEASLGSSGIAFAFRKRERRSIMAKKKKKAAKRELIDTGRDKRYVRRDTEGKFKESDDQGRSLSKDRKKKANRKVKSGQGDKGDR
jgi:hypothetical protein